MPIRNDAPVHRPSPVRGEQVVEIAVPADKASHQAAMGSLRRVDPRDLDQFLRTRQAGLQGAQMTPSMKAHLAALPPQTTAQQLMTDLSPRIAGMAEIFADGLVTESEVRRLGDVGGRLAPIAALRYDPALQMLPKDVAQRLTEALFEPVEALVALSRRHTIEVVNQVRARDLGPLQERMKTGDVGTYRRIDLEAIVRGSASLAGIDRYQPGDLVAVQRSGGFVSAAVVAGKEPDGLRVEVLANGDLGMKTLRPADIVAQNPLRMGDSVRFEGKDVWITGLAQNGKLSAIEQDVATGAHRAIPGDAPAGSPDHDYVAQLAARITAAVADRAQPQAPVQAGVVTKSAGAETVDPVALQGKSAQAALFTSKGVGYKAYNEDAGTIGCIPVGPKVAKEVVFAGAFDQAGGVGDSKATGAASAVAARYFEDAAQSIAKGADPDVTLRAAIAAAHDEVNVLQGGPVTTFAGAFVIGGDIYGVNCGDSGVLHYDRNGRLKNEAETHNFGDQLAKQAGDPNAGLQYANVILTSVGGKNAPEVASFHWQAEPGDYLVIASDGLLDANLQAQKRERNWTRTNGAVTAEQIGGFVRGKPTAMDATRALTDYATSQVVAGAGKPDNLTVAVLRLQ